MLLRGTHFHIVDLVNAEFHSVFSAPLDQCPSGLLSFPSDWERGACLCYGEILAKEKLAPFCANNFLHLCEVLQLLHVGEAGIWREEEITLLAAVRHGGIEDCVEQLAVLLLEHGIRIAEIRPECAGHWNIPLAHRSLTCPH